MKCSCGKLPTLQQWQQEGMGGCASAACRQCLGVLAQIMKKAGLTPQAVDEGSDGQISICAAASDTGAVIFKGDGETYLIGKQKHI